MPRGNSNSNGTKKNKPEFKDFKFVPLTLTEEGKSAFKTWWEEHGADTFVYLDEVVNDGIKVTANWDENNNCYIVSFSCLNERSENYCLVLTSRSDTVFEAIGLNLYKHRVICIDNLWPNQSDKAWG